MLGECFRVWPLCTRPLYCLYCYLSCNSFESHRVRHLFCPVGGRPLRAHLGNFHVPIIPSRAVRVSEVAPLNVPKCEVFTHLSKSRAVRVFLRLCVKFC